MTAQHSVTSQIFSGAGSIIEYGHSAELEEDTRCFCAHCEEAYENREELETHIFEAHLDNDQFNSNGLEKKRKAEKVVMNDRKIKHIRLRLEQECTSCPKCGVSYESKEELVLHIPNCVMGRRFCCIHCSERFQTFDEMKQHAEIHKDELHFECKYCGAKFVTANKLYEHSLSHRDKHTDSNKHSESPRSRYIGNKKHSEPPIFHGNCNTYSLPSIIIVDHIVSNVLSEPLVIQNEPTHSSETFQNEPADSSGTFQNSKIEDNETRKRVIRFTCEICGKQYSTLRNFKAHQNWHNGEKPFICEKCGRRFYSLRNLSNHMPVHSEERRFLCSHCPMAFRWRHGLNSHMNTHQKPGTASFECTICHKILSSKTSLAHHRTIHSGEKLFPCPTCDKAFNKKQALEIHMKQFHEGAPVFKCSSCRKVFFSEEEYKIHTTDDKCSFEWPPHRKLLKNFTCDVCDKQFAIKVRFDSHRRIHTGERPYKCDKCDKSYRLASSLSYHKQSVHDNSVFPCSVCNQSYRSKVALRVHKKIHLNIRPHVCSFCHRAFSRKTFLKNHVRLHTGEKPYVCDNCGQAFVQKVSLILHKKKHKDCEVTESK